MRFVLCLLSVFFSLFASAVADVRVGAPRPLSDAGLFITGTHAQPDGQNLNFVRVENARPSLWRATVTAPLNATPNWRTMPHREQSPYLLEALSSQRAVSPDGSHVAYVSRRGGLEGIYLIAFEDFGREERARRIATLARNPAWLDGSTLLYESTRPGRSGLFKVEATTDLKTPLAPQLLFPRGGESAVAPDGQTICLAATIENNTSTQLYLLSVDGSGARAIPQTEGARRPCFAPDGSAIYYDAPAPHEQGSPLGEIVPRVLWTAPLMPAPPTAQLSFVREAENGDAEIVGTVFSGQAGTLQAKLEFWPGDETAVSERAQFELPVKAAPIHSGVLARWPLPRTQAGAPQHWTLRLSATNANGESSDSTLTFRWPPAPVAAAAPLLFGESTLSQTSTALPVEEAPSSNSVIVPPAVASPVASSSVKDPPVSVPPTPNPPVTRPVSASPVTPLFPPPAANASAGAKDGALNNDAAGDEASPRIPQPLMALPAPALPDAPEDEPETSPYVIPKPPAPRPAPPKADAPRAPQLNPSAPRMQIVDEPVRNSTPQAKKAAPRQAPPKKQETRKPEQRPGGIPSQMKVGSTTPVAVTLRNTGSRGWSSTGEAPVRLIIRWIRAENNSRHRWSVKWLPKAVPPGGSTVVKFDLDAPTAPGRYILTYALVRLNDQIYDGKNYKPPSLNSPDHRWPGEFGAVSFEVNVTR